MSHSGIPHSARPRRGRFEPSLAASARLGRVDGAPSPPSSFPSRRHSMGDQDASASSTTTTDALSEPKPSPRPNQNDGAVDVGSDVGFDEEDDEQTQSESPSHEQQRDAVESAADALLQRLRSRARVAKQPNREIEMDGDGDESDNQEASEHPLDHPLGSLQELPPPLSVTQLRVSGRVSHASSSNSSLLDLSERPLPIPTMRSETVGAARLLPSQTYRTLERLSPLPSHPRADWHMAFMTRANQHRLPGEQLDLPDFTDDVSSDMSSHDRVEGFLDDSAISDGELMLSARSLDHDENRSDDYALSDEERQEDYGDGEPNDQHREFEPGNVSATSLSNRDINVSKAIALNNAMQRNLARLGFDQDLARTALDAGVNEIEQYDSDCELAYVDIFMTLVKLVCDAHHDISPPTTSSPPNRPHLVDRGLGDGSPRPRVQFKWPVFDMAQFEFGNARAGTCFESVCVLINLPKVAMDRTEELMEVLSSCLFCMIGDPIQVLIPSVSVTGRTKGHAFLEFDDPAMAQACTAAVDGLTWGRGPYGRIRAKLFRQYQVKSPVPPTVNPHSTSSAFYRDQLSRPPRRLDVQHHTLGQLPRGFNEDSNGPDLRQSRELSREDLNSSNVSNSVSWNTDSQTSLGFDGSGHRRALFNLSTTSNGQQLQHSLSSLEELAFHRARGDGAMHLGELRLSSEFDDDDGESSAAESDLELAEAILNRGRTDPSTSSAGAAHTQQIQSLQNSLPLPPQDPSIPLMRFMPSASLSNPMAHSSSSPARRPLSGVDIEGPWKAYCEELIQRNREMQEQVAYARRRIAALGHNNQKLHLLIDRMERDRDGLMFENDLLQTQLHGYEDHERQQEALMKELAALRRRMKRRDQRIERGLLDSGVIGNSSGGVAVDLEGGVMTLDELEEQLIQNIVSSRRLDDLKEWEQMLEGSLVRVRSIKEEIALELQKKVAQQADDQVQDHKLCVVCLSKEKSILCLPCRHLCLCRECSQHAELDKCPICRLVVENMLLVYA